ncbi:CCHC-type domain-containing protein, partial [Durusdinium trenchii]
MSLESGKRISGRIARILPVTAEVIERVNTLGTQQKQPQIRDGRLLFEWRPGNPVDGDVYLVDEVADHEFEERDNREIIPEPIDDDAVENRQEDDRDTDEANEVTDETDDGNQDETSDSLSEDASESESDSPSSNTTTDEESDSEETSSEEETNESSSEEETNESNDTDDDLESQESDDDSASYSDESSDKEDQTIDNYSPEQEDDSTTADTDIGRNSRERVPNPRYFGDDYVNFQFLQNTFESLDEDSRAKYLEYALEDYRMSGKTTLVERFLTGVILTQMSARAGLIKHGKNAEKVLLKEFTQFKDMDVMEALDPDKLTPQQIKDALGMIGVIQEKRNHTPEAPELKYRGCADGRKERGKYTKEETASPTNSLDAFMMTLMTDAMEGRDVAISDVVGAYLNAMMREFVAMKIVGREAELMCELNPAWKQHLRYDKRGRAILYVRLKKALYG